MLLHRQPRTEADQKHYINLYLQYATVLAYRAGHVWDSIVSAESPNSTLDGEYSTTIDSQINHFLTIELPAMHIPHSQVPLSNNYDKAAMVLSNSNITILLRHRVMSSLQYDGHSAREFAGLALDIMDHVRTGITTDSGMSRIKHPTFRHHMTSSVAGALLVFCALLVRDLSSPDLNLQHNYHTYLEGYQDAVTMLDLLKHHFGYANRILQDFKPLLSVVGPLVQEWLSYAPDQRAQEGFDLVKFLVPPNIAELFPYRALTPSLQANNPNAGETFSVSHEPGGGWDGVVQSVSRGTVLWL